MLKAKQFVNSFIRSVSETKKFYKLATVHKTGDIYEVDLDSRKLRSPLGKIIQLQTDSLAHAVALEWNSQHEKVKLHQLPLTTLCFHACDNLGEKSLEDISSSILTFLETDTVLYYMNEIPELFALQEKKWTPLIKWLNKRFQIEVESTTGFNEPKICENSIPVLKRHLMSYDGSSLLVIEKMSAVLKSVILALAVVDKRLSCDEAVELALLEQRFQISKWGNVEWYHDIELHESIMKTAACSIYIQLSNEIKTIKETEQFIDDL